MATNDQESFVDVWNRATTLDEVAEAYPHLQRQTLIAKASRLRTKGGNLKRFGYNPDEDRLGIFVDSWNSSSTLDEFLGKYPYTVSRKSATAMASTYRSRGHSLTRFVKEKKNTESPAKTGIAKKMVNAGFSVKEIAVIAQVSRQAVYEWIK